MCAKKCGTTGLPTSSKQKDSAMQLNASECQTHTWTMLTISCAISSSRGDVINELRPELGLSVLGNKRNLCAAAQTCERT